LVRTSTQSPARIFISTSHPGQNAPCRLQIASQRIRLAYSGPEAQHLAMVKEFI
jgi:hypothetical protein